MADFSVPAVPDDADSPQEVAGQSSLWDVRAALPALPLNFPFPHVQSEDPDERAEVLRQFVAWENHPEEARQLVLRSLWRDAIDWYLPERSGMAAVRGRSPLRRASGQLVFKLLQVSA